LRTSLGPLVSVTRRDLYCFGTLCDCELEVADVFERFRSGGYAPHSQRIKFGNLNLHKLATIPSLIVIIILTMISGIVGIIIFFQRRVISLICVI
jgi:hypothetical protein